MRILMALSSLAVLAACSGQPAESAGAAPEVAEAPLAPVPTDPLAGPSGMDNLTWIYDEGFANGSGRPRLLYSARANDELGINLQCASPGAVEAIIVRDGAGEALRPRQFTLRSGAASAVLTGAASGEAGGETVIRANIAASEPVLEELRETGRLSVMEGGLTQVFDAVDEAERRTIRQFFTACA